MSTLEVVRIAGLATVQDGGRPGHMHEGVPPGGALVPELLASANVALGNRPDAAAIELMGRMTIRAGEGGLCLATEGGEPVIVAQNAELEVSAPSSLRVGYLAVRGGIAVPVVLGGRGTLVVAALGGFEGRGLRRGDRLAVREGTCGKPGDVRLSFRADGPVRVMPGPDEARFDPTAMGILTSSAFTVLPSSDRVGTRLEGPALPRRSADDTLSVPMVAGAIEVPASGPPIVLGPDHPTTGGYPVLAVVVRADLGRFAARPVGSQVRFAPVSLEELRAR